MLRVNCYQRKPYNNVLNKPKDNTWWSLANGLIRKLLPSLGLPLLWLNSRIFFIPFFGFTFWNWARSFLMLKVWRFFHVHGEFCRFPWTQTRRTTHRGKQTKQRRRQLVQRPGTYQAKCWFEQKSRRGDPCVCARIPIPGEQWIFHPPFYVAVLKR